MGRHGIASKVRAARQGHGESAPPLTELPANDSSVKLALSKVTAPTAPPVWSARLPLKLLRTRLMSDGESCTTALVTLEGPCWEMT